MWYKKKTKKDVEKKRVRYRWIDWEKENIWKRNRKKKMWKRKIKIVRIWIMNKERNEEGKRKKEHWIRY